MSTGWTSGELPVGKKAAAADAENTNGSTSPT